MVAPITAQAGLSGIWQIQENPSQYIQMESQKIFPFTGMKSQVATILDTAAADFMVLKGQRAANVKVVALQSLFNNESTLSVTVALLPVGINFVPTITITVNSCVPKAGAVCRFPTGAVLHAVRIFGGG